MLKSSKLNQLVYFFAFLPFVNFGIPIFNSDTQPFYFLLAIHIVFYNLKSYRIKRDELSLIIIALISTVVLLLVGLEMKKCFNLLIISLVSIFFSRNTYSLILIRSVLVIYCAFILLWLLSSDIAYTLQSSIVRNINDRIRTFRGIPVLATEAGLYAGTGVMLIELYLLKLKSKLEFIDYALISLILLSIILSFSGSSIVFITVFLLLRVKKFKYVLFIGIIMFFLPDIMVSLFPNTRLSYLASLLSYEKFHLIFRDSSFVYRLTSLFLAFEFFISNPFGALFVENLEQKIQSIYYYNYYDPSIGMDYNYHLVSGFGEALIGCGVLCLLFFVILVKKFFNIQGLFYFLLCVSFSYSLIYPVSLILLIENSKKKNVWNFRNNIK